MSQLRASFPVLLVLAACGSGASELDTTTDGEDTDDGWADAADCASFVTEPHNSCEGHDDFGVELIGVRDEDGDGSWAPGEWLDVDVRFSSAEEHMWYPGVIFEGPDELVQAEQYGNGSFYWWYVIEADSSYEASLRFTAAADAARGEVVELVLTVGALNCLGQEDEWSDCPHPTPLVVDVPIE